MKTIPDLIREEIAARGWSQNALGREAGLSSSSMADLMTGKYGDIRVTALAKILRALGKSWAWIDGAKILDPVEQS